MGVTEVVRARWRCPDCHGQDLEFVGEVLICRGCGGEFPAVGGVPALVRHDNEVFPIESYGEAAEKSAVHRLARLVPSPSVNLSLRANLDRFAASLPRGGAAPVLVVGSGRQREWFGAVLSGSPDVIPVYIDVDRHASVDLFCDAHEICFVDGCFRGVVATAVLEHVLYPERVVGELFRVLEEGGVVYSEVPFMQQVHEGAFDFTRYTLSGHRRLFNRFEEVDSGLIAGPATAFVWATESLVVALTGWSRMEKLTRAGVRLGLGWVKYLDYLLKGSAAALDSASCTYFLGRKRAGHSVSDREVVSRYSGGRHVQHLGVVGGGRKVGGTGLSGREARKGAEDLRKSQ